MNKRTLKGIHFMEAFKGTEDSFTQSNNVEQHLSKQKFSILYGL